MAAGNTNGWYITEYIHKCGTRVRRKYSYLKYICKNCNELLERDSKELILKPINYGRKRKFEEVLK